MVGPLIPEADDKLNRYDQIAFGLMKGEGFSMHGAPTAVSAPVYPLMLSGLYLLFGYSATVVRLFFSVLDAAHCVFFYSIARRYFGGKVAILTALALLLSPLTIYCILTLPPEIPFLFLHALFILCLVVALQGGRRRYFLMSGMALGAATLARAVPLLLPLFLLPVFLVNAGWLKKGLLHFAIFLVGFMALIVPWMARNYVALDTFVPVQTHGGSHLYMATPAPREDRLQEKVRSENMDPIEQDRFYYGRAWQRIRENPSTFVRSMGYRLLEMWYRTDSRRFEKPLFFGHVGLLVLATAGMILTRQRWREQTLFYAVIAYYIVLHTVLIALLRYTLPIIPLLTAFAMVPISYVLNRPGNRLGPG
jgi:4-amino-4-deoxy-L-arabinose transferase-like glycosyltransferase